MAHAKCTPIYERLTGRDLLIARQGLIARGIPEHETFRALALGGAGFTPGVAPWVNAQPSDRALAEEAWQRSRETGSAFGIEFKLWKPDGEVFWLNISTQPTLGSRNEITGFVGTAHDVTEAVNRRVLSNQLIGLLDSSADAVIVFDPHGRPG